MDAIVSQKARRMLEPLVHSHREPFDPTSFIRRVATLSDQLFGVASVHDSAARSASGALEWAKRPLPDEYAHVLALTASPPYEPSWDRERFPGFGFALVSAALYLDHQLANETLRHALSVRLARESDLPRTVQEGLSKIEDFFYVALALESEKEAAKNSSFRQQLISAFSAFDDARDEFEERGRLWDQQVSGWGVSVGVWEPWRDLPTMTVVHFNGLLGQFYCTITHPRGPDRGPDRGPGPRPRPGPGPDS